MRLFSASPVIIDNYASIKEDLKDIIEGKWVEEEKETALDLAIIQKDKIILAIIISNNSLLHI